MIYSPRAFFLLAKNSRLSISDDRSFKSHFGTNIDVASIVWDMMKENRRRPLSMRPIHLLWGLLFLKTYSTTDVLAASVGTSRNTLRKWIWIVLRQIQKLKRKVVSDRMVHVFLTLAFTHISCQVLWERRKEQGGHQNRWCMITVDGTDFRIQEPSPFSPCWFSHKYKGPRVRYEVALSINGGDIVHINGPFACGSHPDITIFRQRLLYKLEPGEMAEADRGYRGEPDHIRIPSDYQNPQQKVQKCRARARQETVNHRFKVFGALSQRFRHHISLEDMSLHKTVFESIVVLTQLDIDFGNRLFAVPFH